MFCFLIFISMASAQLFTINYDSLIKSSFKDNPELIPYFKNHLALEEKKSATIEKNVPLLREISTSTACLQFITFGANYPLPIERIAKTNILEARISLRLKDKHRDTPEKRIYIIAGQVPQQYKDCVPPLSESYTKTRKIEIANYAIERSIIKKGEAEIDLNTHHPRDRAILTDLINKADPKIVKEKGLANYVYSTYLNTYASEYNKKAEEEFIPMIEKNCPNLTAHLWGLCKSDHRYPHGSFMGISRKYCILDYENFVDEKCFKK